MSLNDERVIYTPLAADLLKGSEAEGVDTKAARDRHHQEAHSCCPSRHS